MSQKSYNPDIQKVVEQGSLQRVINTVVQQVGASLDEVEDVSGNPEYFKKDIDFILQGATYEVKIDTYDTGHCFLETISNARTGALGWLFVSQAKWLIYAFPKQDVAYAADMRTLRNWFLDNIYWFIVNQKGKKVKTDNGEGYKYESFGFVASLETLTDQGIFKKFDLI